MTHATPASGARPPLDYTVEEVHSGPVVDTAYAALAAWFGVRGELERREVIDSWLERPEGQRVGNVQMRYHLLVARGPDGALAAVRDCHTTVDRVSGICVMYLAHVFVDPTHRRTGLAQRLRDVPLELARRDLADWGISCRELLLAVEQEPVVPEKEDTVVRLVAYGRAGFKAVDPAVMPYFQPDFSALAAAGGPASPLPLLAVVRRVGHEHEAHLPIELAAAFVRHLYAIFSTHCRESDLAPLLAHTLNRLEASGLTAAPLLALPHTLDDTPAMEPLLEANVLEHYEGV